MNQPTAPQGLNNREMKINNLMYGDLHVNLLTSSNHFLASLSTMVRVSCYMQQTNCNSYKMFATLAMKSLAVILFLISHCQNGLHTIEWNDQPQMEDFLLYSSFLGPFFISDLII